MRIEITPLKLSIQQVAEMTGESIPLIYAAIRDGDLDTFLVGRRRFARPEAVRKWIDFLEARSNAGKPVTYLRKALVGDRAGSV